MGVMGLISYMRIIVNAYHKLLKEEVRDEVDILHAERQSFLQVDFNTLAIKVSYKVILTLLIVILKVLKVKRLYYLYNITKLN